MGWWLEEDINIFRWGREGWEGRREGNFPWRREGNIHPWGRNLPW